MCDVMEYNKIYKKINMLSVEDTQQIILASEDEDEKCFYEMVCNYILQKRQRIAIERKLF